MTKEVRTSLLFAIIALLAIMVIGCAVNNLTKGQSQVNITELDTLDRMRFTAIQMTILSLESQQPTNMSNDEIAAAIYDFQQNNKTDRLTTVQIESLYRNITNGSQVGR
jgi:hypothetical protein